MVRPDIGAGAFKRAAGGGQAGAVRILHVTQVTKAGVGSFLDEIGPYQSRLFGEENVRFIVPEGSAEHLPQIRPQQLIAFGGTSRGPVDLLRFALCVRRAIQQLKPTIVHLHSSFAGVIGRAVLSTLPHPPKVVYCPHGWAFSIESSAARKQAYAALERRLAQNTDLILVNSQSEHDLAMQYRLPAEKTRVVKNGIAWADAADRRPPAGPIRLAFIGRDDRQKGLDFLLETLARFSFPEIHFDIVGAAGSGMARTGTYSRNNIVFHGWKPRAEVVELLRQVDAVIMPSRWDAAPLVAAEAMRAGLPVLASDRGALPEIVQDGECGHIFHMNDFSSLVRVLEGLTRPDLQRLGANARLRWQQEYLADKMNARTVAFYEQALSATMSEGRATLGRDRDRLSRLPG